MDDFNDGNNFDNYNEDDDDSSIIDDIRDVKDKSKELKNEYKNYKSSRENNKLNSSLSDNGKNFRQNMRSTNNSRSVSQTTSEINKVNPNVVNNNSIAASNTGVTTGASGTAASGTAASGAAASGTAASGTAASGAAASGAAASGAAASGAAASGAAASGTAASGAAASGAAAGASATGVGAVIVAAIALLGALKKIKKKIDKKIEEKTGVDKKTRRTFFIIAIFGFIFFIIFMASSLFVTSDTAYDELSSLIKRREERYGKPLILFTNAEYDELISTDYPDDNCYTTILKNYGNDLNNALLAGVDTSSIQNDETITKEKKELLSLALGTDEVKKYLKAQRENFNKIIWNTSSGYNTYSFAKNVTYTDWNTYDVDNSGNAQLTNNAATISNGIHYSDDNILYWNTYIKANEGLSMYEIKDFNNNATGLKIPEIVLEGESDKDEAGEYYVELLQDHLQQWFIPYTMLFDCQDKEFVNKVMNEMYHRIDVNVYKLSQEVKTTKKIYYMKAKQSVYIQEYTIYDGDTAHMVDPSTIEVIEYTNLNTKDDQIGTTVDIQPLGKVTKDGKSGSRYKEIIIKTELDESMEIAKNSDGSPMVKEINVVRNILPYKNVPQIINIESFYDITRQKYKVVAINESNPANVVSPTKKDIDKTNGTLTETYTENWYEELEQVGQTEKKNYSVSYYTDEQLESMGKKISRVEWAQDYGTGYLSSISSSTTKIKGETGGENTKTLINNKTYKLYDQGDFKGNIPSAGSGLSATCIILSVYRPDLDLNPNGLATEINWKGAQSLLQTQKCLAKYGLKVELYRWLDYSDLENKKNQSYEDIKKNLQVGRPVIVLVNSPNPYTSAEQHYLTLIDIDDNFNVTIADSNGGITKKDTLTNIIGYMFDNANSENGYILINSDDHIKEVNTSSNSSDSKSADNQKLEEMIQYSISLTDKIRYQLNGNVFSTKAELENGSCDCSGFVASLYNIFFNVNIAQVSKYDMFDTCEQINEKGLVGKKIFKSEGTSWNDEISSKIQPGDIVNTPGHISMYIGDVTGDGKGDVISHGGGSSGNVNGPQLYTAEECFSWSGWEIKGIARYIFGSTDGSDTSKLIVDNSRIYPTKTSKELQDAYNKYANGKGYSYDDLYFAFYHIEQYYSEINDVNGSSSESSNGSGLGWPIDIKRYPECATINCFYGYTPAYGSNHNGIDISSGGYVSGTSLHIGPEIIAAHDGKVIVATSNPSSDASEYTYVQIESEDGTIQTQYGHLSKIYVNYGDTVKKGDVIGKMGNTGRSTGTHLHYAVFVNGTRIDPLEYYIISKENSDEEVEYSKIDKNSITSVPSGYKFLREKGGGSQELVDFVFGWEGTTPVSSDGKQYQIVIDSVSGTRTVGRGIDLDAGGYADILEKAGYSSSVGSWVDKEFLDSLALKELTITYRDPVIARVSGLDLEEYQIDALVSRAYNMGEEGALGDLYTSMDFVTAYKKYWKKSDKKNTVDYSHPLYTNYMQHVTNGGLKGLILRREAEWRLFQTGVYDSSH